MKKIVIASALLTILGAAHARPICDAPMEAWIKEADFRKTLLQQGYMIKTFQVSNGCYEVYGLDRLGRRVDVYFDPANGMKLEWK